MLLDVAVFIEGEIEVHPPIDVSGRSSFQQPTKGHTKHQKLKPRKGEVVQLRCDIHDFMRGWLEP